MEVAITVTQCLRSKHFIVIASMLYLHGLLCVGCFCEVGM